MAELTTDARLARLNISFLFRFRAILAEASPSMPSRMIEDMIAAPFIIFIFPAMQEPSVRAPFRRRAALCAAPRHFGWPSFAMIIAGYRLLFDDIKRDFGKVDDWLRSDA